ncbi:MAG: hypothetical protein KDH96_13065 [Candidatus Riesia sp.]|nr:hypothetical protein [Candidatus Riesia sp.]
MKNKIKKFESFEPEEWEEEWEEGYDIIEGNYINILITGGGDTIYIYYATLKKNNGKYQMSIFDKDGDFLVTLYENSGNKLSNLSIKVIDKFDRLVLENTPYLHTDLYIYYKSSEEIIDNRYGYMEYMDIIIDVISDKTNLTKEEILLKIK